MMSLFQERATGDVVRPEKCEAFTELKLFLFLPFDAECQYRL